MEGSGVAVDHQAAFVSQAPARSDERRDHRWCDDDEDTWPVTPKQPPHPDCIDEVVEWEQSLLGAAATKEPRTPAQRRRKGLGSTLVVVPRDSDDRRNSVDCGLHSRPSLLENSLSGPAARFTLNPTKPGRNGRLRTDLGRRARARAARVQRSLPNPYAHPSSSVRIVRRAEEGPT